MSNDDPEYSKAEQPENVSSEGLGHQEVEQTTPLAVEVPRHELIMELLPEAQLHLNAIRKWTQFFAVLGYVAIAIFLIAGVVIFAVITELGNINGIEPEVIGVIYFLMAALYIYPVAKLLEFSGRMKKSLGFVDAQMLNAAFKSLRQHFAYVGWLTVGLIVLYFLIFIGAMVGAVGAGFGG